jgi:hypothetical protein
MEINKPSTPEVENSKKFVLDIYTPQRLEGETFEDYKIRRKVAKIAIKNYLKGRR